MAKNYPPPAQLTPSSASSVYEAIMRQRQSSNHDLPTATLEPPVPQFAPPTSAYDNSGVGSLFEQDPQMLMHRDRGHDLVQRGLAAVPGSLAPIPSEVMDRGMYVDAPDMTGDRMEFDAPDRTNDRMYLPKQSAPMRINAPVPIESQMPLDLGGYSPRTQQVQDMFRATRQQGMDSAAAESAQRQAALDQWSQGGGLAPSGRVRASVNGGSLPPNLQSQVDSMAANNPRPSPTTLNRLPPQALSQAFANPQGGTGSSAYLPGGNESYGAIPAVRTGNAFFDDNTNWDQLSKDREIKNTNDAHFTAMNDARLGGIASDRQGAESARRNNLLEQGKSPDEVDRIMFPQRFAQPKDPAIANAQAIDAAERQGRSNLHAIAGKFRRNGLPIDQAYAAAMNTIKTTNPADMGSVPSLPGMDPLRVIGSVGGSAGNAAGAYGVGTARAANELTLGNQSSADRRYEADARERVGQGANMNNTIGQILEWALGSRKQGMNEGVIKDEQGSAQRQQDIDMMNMLINQGAANMPPGDPRRQMYDQIQGRLLGAPMDVNKPQSVEANAAQAGQMPAAAPLSSAMGAAPAGGGTDYAYYASNPAAMAQYLEGVDVNRQPYERARIMAMAGQYSDPYVADYAKGQFAGAPNLEWGFDNEPEVLAKWASQQPGGLPYDAYLPAARQYYGQ